MDNGQYTKREIDLILNGLKQHLDDKLSPISDTLREIKAQTEKTNGRVTRLEGHRLMLVGMWMVTTLGVIPLVSYIFSEKVQLIRDLAEKVAADYK